MTSAVPRPTGMFLVGTTVIVAQPFMSVRTSGVLRAHEYGRPITCTSASRTTNPRVSTTCTRSTNALRPCTAAGVTLLMIMRSGRLTLDAGIDVAPCVVLTAPAGPGWPTTAVCAEVAEPEPLGFVAFTTTRIVWFASSFLTEYVCAVAPVIAAQLLPAVSQRSHW